jgi:TRAP-type mannitol/chloroaromatic compound transport system substrate-binding protein
MKRKLITALSAAVLAVTLSGNAMAAKKVLLKVPVWFGTHLTGLGSTPKWLAEHVNEASGGSVKIKIYEPGKLLPPKEILESVSKGQVNAGWSTPGYNSGLLGQKGTIFSAVPFGPEAPEFLA